MLVEPFPRAAITRLAKTARDLLYGAPDAADCAAGSATSAGTTAVADSSVLLPASGCSVTTAEDRVRRLLNARRMDLGGAAGVGCGVVVASASGLSSGWGTGSVLAASVCAGVSADAVRLAWVVPLEALRLTRRLKEEARGGLGDLASEVSWADLGVAAGA